jgi:hypothetical protein
LVVIGAVLLWLVPAAGASAATCTGTPRAVGHNETSADVVDVTCDTAISDGSLTIETNRGAGEASATVSNGTGSLNCSAQPQPPGSQFPGKITCTGSLGANATATVKTEFAPGACQSPAFAGQLTVSFGDGTTFGPSALAPYQGCDDTGGGGGGGGEQCDTVRSGHDCDPGGVFQGTTKKPPRKASVKAARKGLKFALKLGVKGKAVTTIEVKGHVVGKRTGTVSAGGNNLVARLSKSAANDLEDKTTKALIHVEVIPGANEGFTTHGREYFKLTLTG